MTGQHRAASSLGRTPFAAAVPYGGRPVLLSHAIGQRALESRRVDPSGSCLASFLTDGVGAGIASKAQQPTGAVPALSCDGASIAGVSRLARACDGSSPSAPSQAAPARAGGSSPTFGDPRLPARFWAKVNPNGSVPAHRPDLGPCWLWMGAHNPKGYGRFVAVSRNRGMVYPHRLARETLIGPIPSGFQCDHLCLNPSCANPNHIEVVTSQINTLRGVSPSAINASKTHCPQGHPYAGPNLYQGPSGWRQCRQCQIIRRKASQDSGLARLPAGGVDGIPISGRVLGSTGPKGAR